jgi:membrane-associated phospholipid phosphatase
MTTPQRSLLAPASPRPGTGTGKISGSPVWSAVAVTVVGYAALAIVMLGVGVVLTHGLSSSVGRWDEHINQSLARHRTAEWNDVTKYATSMVNTLPAIVIAAFVAGFLALRRLFREALFLILALVLEITVFLSVTFIVARPRPDVPRLNATPSTSSFPSGHTAAATVLFVGIALIVACRTDRWYTRAAGAAIALAIVVVVGFGRVYRGMHHPTDVIAGLVLGLACLAISMIAVRAFVSAHDVEADVKAGSDRASTEAVARSSALVR